MLNTDYLQSLKKGYLNEDGVIRIEFVDGFPQTVAKDFGNSTPALSTSQSRAFFDKVNSLNVKAKSNQMKLSEVQIELSMLKSRIQDKVSKNTLPKEFYDFFNANVSAIKDLTTLNAFTFHFEAVCNYMKDVKANDNGMQNRNGFSQKPNFNNNRR